MVPKSSPDANLERLIDINKTINNGDNRSRIFQPGMLLLDMMINPTAKAIRMPPAISNKLGLIDTIETRFPWKAWGFLAIKESLAPINPEINDVQSSLSIKPGSMLDCFAFRSVIVIPNQKPRINNKGGRGREIGPIDKMGNKIVTPRANYQFQLVIKQLVKDRRQ